LIELSHTNWLNVTSLGPPARKVLQQSLLLLTKTKSLPELVVSTSLQFAHIAVEMNNFYSPQNGRST